MNQEQVAALVEGGLNPAVSEAVERELRGDEEALRYVLAQREMDRVLRSLLGRMGHKEQIRAAIMSAISGGSAELLSARVLADTSGRSGQRDSKRLIEDGWWTAALRESRRFFKPVLAAGLGVALLVVLLWSPWTSISAGPEVGHVATVIGRPSLQRAGERVPTPVRAAEVVRLGDRFETGDGDQAEIHFQDGTTLRLGFNTLIAVPDPKTKTPSRKFARPPQIDLLHGQVWTKVQKTTNGPPAPYAIRTAPATAVARGTEFSVKLSRSKAFLSTSSNSPSDTNAVAVLTVREGTVDFVNDFGAVRATAMTESTARVGTAPTEPKRLQSMQSVQLPSGSGWKLITSSLSASEAGERLAGGGGFAGLRLVTLPASAAAAGGTPPPAVVQIAQVEPDSAAARAGLQPGDAVLALDGAAITNASELAKSIRLRPNSALSLTVRREGAEKRLPLQVEYRTNELRSSVFSRASTVELSALMQRWLSGPAVSSAAAPAAVAAIEKQREADAHRLTRSNPLRAAAYNNLGVLFELEDALGAAVRAYGRAVYLDPRAPLYRFNLGLALCQIGSFERAAEELATALRLAPDSRRARQGLAVALALLGENVEALALVETALQQDPRAHGLWELKAQILSTQHRFEEARLALLKAIELEPHCFVAHNNLGLVLSEQGSFGQARAAYQRAIELNPSDAAAQVNLGDVQQSLGELALAEQSFRKALELQPDFALAYSNLGNLLAQRHEFTNAAAALRKAIELDPDDASAHIRLGRVSLKQRQFDLAEKSLRTALEISPSSAAAYSLLGQIRRERGQFSEAEQMYRKAIELDPQYPNAHTFLAALQSKRGELVQAEESYRRAIALAPSLPEPYVGLGELYREKFRQLEKAEELFRQAIQIAPSYAPSYGGLGMVMSAKGQTAEAERLVRKACALDPEHPQLRNNLGVILFHAGRLDEAAQHYRKALEFDPNIPSAYNNLGVIYATRGDLAEAENMFRALAQRAPDAAAYVNLGNVLGDQGKLEEAESNYRHALALKPNDLAACNSLAFFLADHQLKLDEALALARRGAQVAPSDPGILDTFGWVQFQRGELDEAEKTLQTALALAGEKPPAAEIREHLKKVSAKKGAGAQPATASETKPTNSKQP